MNADGFIVVGLIVLVVVGLLIYCTPGLGGRVFSATFDAVLRMLFQYRDIMKPEGLYLRRFFITPHRWLGYDQARRRSRWPRFLGWVPVQFRKIFVHHILLSDSRTPHDHPWPFRTIILAGEYTESMGYKGASWRRATCGTYFENGAGHIHYLTIVRPVWSLVLAGESKRVWGFWLTDTDGRGYWQDWRTYLRLVGASTEPEDQIDPNRYPGGAMADKCFSVGDRLSADAHQPTGLWRDPRREPARRISVPTPTLDAVPELIPDEPTTRKIVAAGPDVVR